MPRNTLFSFLTQESPEAVGDHRHAEWGRGNQVTLDRDWLGRSFLREEGLQWKNLTQVSSLWTPEQVFFMAECWFDHLVNDDPEVLEIIIRPENSEDYFHWQISPPNRCVDCHVREPRVDLNFHWSSHGQLKIEVNQEERIWRAFLALPFAPMIEASQCEKPPEVGDVWGLNFCRRTSTGDIVFWRPSYGAQPDFHETSCLGNLFFLEE